MRAGLAVWLDRPVRDCAEIAVAAEAAGFSDVWLPDHYFLRDVFVAQALMAMRTSRVRLGTAVVSPLLRHPALLASSTATIQELSGGRAVIGIGAGGFEFPTQLGFRMDRPIGLLREAVRIVRAVIRGEEMDIRGGHFTATGTRLLWRVEDVPVYLAARGPQMLELAGEIAEGVITHGLAPSYIDFSLDRIARGTKRGGRPPDACELALMFDVEVDDDVDAAVDRLRPRVTVMAGGAYAEELIPVLGLDPGQVLPLRAAVRTKDPDAARLVTDDMVRAFTVAGPAGHVAERLAQMAEAGVGRVVITTGGRSLEEAVRAVERVGKAIAAVIE
jgi:5,10-methylenetetrahydromethanopterin reductase